MKKVLLFLGISMIYSLAFSQVGVNTENPQGIFNIDGGKNNAQTGTPTSAQQKDDFVVLADGSVGIGTTQPDASAILELNVSELASGNQKGFLAPKVALDSRTDAATIPSPAKGLLVYNLGTGDLKYDGYVFWNGSEWRALDNSSLQEGTLGSITCNGVTLTSSIYTAGVPFEGTMNVPYTGGNGGTYPAQTVGPVNGLTATLSAGNFANGAGTLSYTVTGIPTITSPDVTTFSLNIGGQNCDAVIGAGDSISAGELVFYKTDPIPTSIGGGGNNGTTAGNWLSAHAADLPVIAGKLRLDGYFSAPSTGEGTISFNPRLVNISDNPVRFHFSAMSTVESFNTANLVLAANGGWTNLDNGIYNGYGENGTTASPVTAFQPGNSSTEIVTVDLSVDDKWYRIYYYPIIDNQNTNIASDNMRIIYLSIQRLY